MGVLQPLWGRLFSEFDQGTAFGIQFLSRPFHVDFTALGAFVFDRLERVVDEL